MAGKRRFLTHLSTIRAGRPLAVGSVILLAILIVAATALFFFFFTHRTTVSVDTTSGFVKNTLAKFISQELDATLDTDRLPADGKSTTILTATLMSGGSVASDQSAIVAQAVSGDVAISPQDKSQLFQRFLIKAGRQAGPVKLTVKAGLLEKTLTLTLFDPTPPATPVIKSPASGDTTSSSKPEIKGSAPAGSKVTIFVDAFEAGSGQTNDQGNFSVIVNDTLKNGPHLVRAVAENQYGVKSLPSDTVRINVNTKALTIDLDNLRVTPNPVARGEIFSVFVPASVETTQLFVILNNVQYALTDRYQSSIFSGRLTAPKAPGSYPLTILAQDSARNSTFFNNAITLKVS
jgi:hypothetical protein